jgi:hypothetical protein
MAVEIHQFTVTIPKGTLPTTPAIFNLTMPSRVVEEVDVRVPPGPRGEVGWALGASGLAVLPFEPGAFMVADGETVTWPLSEQIDSGAWQMIAYNTGSFNHKLYVTFKTRLPVNPAALVGFQPLSPVALSS